MAGPRRPPDDPAVAETGAAVTRALIVGVTGQDGSYLAQHLTGLGYQVWGGVRGPASDHPKASWLRRLLPDLRLVEADLLDEASLHQALWIADPDEVYNLAAISSPSLAWTQPLLTAQVTALGVTRLLNVLADRPDTRLVQAGSLATHGPYGAAKQYAEIMCRDARERGRLVSVAAFGGHHSPRRGRSYFSHKVTSAVSDIKAGRRQTLELGWLGRMQDWGWADNFVEALPEVARLPPGRYVVSTGEPHSCQEWVEQAFRVVDLDWRDHVLLSPALGNLTDVATLSAPPDERLTWRPRLDFTGLVRHLMDADL